MRRAPDPAEEIWRYSRIDELDLDRFTPGRPHHDRGRRRPRRRGERPSPDVVGGAAPDIFAELNTAFMTPLRRARPGRSARHRADRHHPHVAGEGTAAFPRLVIDAGADSEVTVVERFTSADGEPSLVVPVAPGARRRRPPGCRYLGVNELGDAAWQIGHQQAIGDRDSTITLATVALGGDYARVRTEARVAGPGGSTRQIALYFAGGEQMHDFRTIQDHDAPHTTSDLLFKGAVQDRRAASTPA